jgi:hypothetical protein
MRALGLLVLVACGGTSRTPPAGTDSGTQLDGNGTDGPLVGPRCAARDCGGDDLGGSCGTCGASFTCDPDHGLCIPGDGTEQVSVSFGEACWFVCPATPIPGFTCTAGQRFQAIQFNLQTQFPIEGTLYFDNDCDPADGTDNLNDTGAETPTSINLEWFIHHPDTRPSSAVWWFSHTSTGCVDYTSAPDCP